MDTLRLNDLEVLCILGDRPEERVHPQRVLVNLALEVDLEAASVSDALGDTVDYATLAFNVREALEAAKCRLLERAAGVVADVCLEDPRVERVTVSVRKFNGIAGLGSAEVTLSRNG